LNQNFLLAGLYRFPETEELRFLSSLILKHIPMKRRDIKEKEKKKEKIKQGTIKKAVTNLETRNKFGNDAY